MKMYDSGFKLKTEDLLKYEKQLNLKFPEDYKLFMIEHNGGYPEKNIAFDFIDVLDNKSNSSDVNCFLIFYDEKNKELDDTIRVYTTILDNGYVRKGYFPIAQDSGGNIICMCLNDDNYGKIYFVYHELEEPETGYLLMTNIANSFTDFISNLYEFN